MHCLHINNINIKTVVFTTTKVSLPVKLMEGSDHVIQLQKLCRICGNHIEVTLWKSPWFNKAGLKHFLIVSSYKTTGETTYDDDLTPVLSLFTGISYFIKPYCWIIFFSLLQLQFYVNLLFKRSKKFSLHTFSFFLLDHHRR